MSPNKAVLVLKYGRLVGACQGIEAMEGIFAYCLDAFVFRVACLPSSFGANKGLRWASGWIDYASYQVDSKTISSQRC